MLIFHRSYSYLTRSLFPLGLLLACICTLLCSYSANAHPATMGRSSSNGYSTGTTFSTSNGPTIDRVNVGFEGNYQDGNWVPIQVNLSNTGDTFDGAVSVNLPTTSFTNTGITNQASNYQQTINLPTGAHKQITLNVPLSLGSQGSNAQIMVNLLDTDGRKVASKIIPAESLNMNTALVGILSNTPNNFDRLNLALSSLLKSAGQTENLTQNTLPEQVALLNNFSAIILDNFTTSALSPSQLTALQGWVNQGGTLILAGGPEANHTLNSLPADLLPVTINGMSNLPAGTHLLPIGSRSGEGQPADDTLKAAVPISTSHIKPDSTVILAAANTPLIVKGAQGQGAVYYLAYDPVLEPLADWQNTEQLWSDLLTRAIGDRMITSNTTNSSNTPWQGTQDASMASLLQTFFPNSYPSVWLILALLLGYVLVLGPVRLLIVRRLKRRNWSWRIVLATIVVFSALSYGLALHQKGTSIINSSISVVQLNRPDATGTAAHTTTYVGVFVPNQGNFDVHIPDSTLVQTGTASNSPYQVYNPQQTNSTSQTTFVDSPDGTDVDLQGVNIWTTRTLKASNEQHLKGGIISHLQQQQSVVSGTVTNTLTYTLEDVYIAMGNTYISLGSLPAGSTRAVKLNLNSSNATTGAQTQMTIADQIAAKRGLNTNAGYSPYNTSNGTQDIAQRHALMLEALSGNYCEADSCYRSNIAISNVNGVITRSFANGTQSSNQDPLLLAGAPATLIGWTNAPLTGSNTTTINGDSANGTQDTLIQAPLDVSMQGPIVLPPGLVNAQIIHLQQDQPNNIQEPSPDSYTLTTGNLTLEYSLPPTLKFRSSQLTFTSNANVTKITNPTMSLSSDINHLQTYLYNWQTGAWDAQTFSQYSLVVNNGRPYIGPGNRVLLHFSNQDATLGTIIFDKPALSLQGTTAS